MFRYIHDILKSCCFCWVYTEGPGELGLRAGDIVTMVEQVDNEWYRGTCRGSSGFFPANYVKVLVSFNLEMHQLVSTRLIIFFLFMEMILNI